MALDNGTVEVGVRTPIVQAAPGTQLLAYVDKPAFASIAIDANQVAGYYPAHAREAERTFNLTRRGMVLTFGIPISGHGDYASGGYLLPATATVRMELSRIAN